MLLPKLFNSVIHFLLIYKNHNGAYAEDIEEEDKDIEKRHEYKFSFKSPKLAQMDGNIPFWKKFGDAIVAENTIRLTTSLRGQKGSVWSTNKTTFDWWQVEMSFRAEGLQTTGGEGFAFWYIEDVKLAENFVFGGPSFYSGLSIFLDSYDDDENKDNPKIMAVTNDGGTFFEYQNDGSDQTIIGSCLADYRNKVYPVRLKVSYYNHNLTVKVTRGMSNAPEEYATCIEVTNLTLPKQGYFGISASTRIYPDNQDILKFQTYSLRPKVVKTATTENNTAEEVEDEDRAKVLESQFQQYQTETEQKVQDYKKEHPEAEIHRKDEWDEPEELISDNYGLELRKIFAEYVKMREGTNAIAQRLLHVIKNTELISGFVKGQAILQATQRGTPNQTIPTNEEAQGPLKPQSSSPIERYEVDNVISAQTELLTLKEEILTLVIELEAKVDTVAVVNSPQEGSEPPQSFVSQEFTSFLEDVKLASTQLRIIYAKMTFQPGQGDGEDPKMKQLCPLLTQQHCISAKMFALISLITSGFVMIFLIYKDSCIIPTGEKKFY